MLIIQTTGSNSGTQWLLRNKCNSSVFWRLSDFTFHPSICFKVLQSSLTSSRLNYIFYLTDLYDFFQNSLEFQDEMEEKKQVFAHDPNCSVKQTTQPLNTHKKTPNKKPHFSCCFLIRTICYSTFFLYGTKKLNSGLGIIYV